ncbi:MAG: DUF192 domain-containing protein [Candidatus Nanohaloarchaea archaeon]|nr:DUF192 domain-containing protein [Candidatus Nanohaloarchaea archaeon]
MQRKQLLVTLAVLVSVFGAAAVLSTAGTATVHTPTGTMTVAVADTPAERQEGLMDRQSVPHDGMLFVFPDAAPRTFWMKDTQIALDIVFIGGNGTVLNVAAAAPDQGQPDTALPRYRSDGPARYVVEVPRGAADRFGLVPGAQVRIQR